MKKRDKFEPTAKANCVMAGYDDKDGIYWIYNKSNQKMMRSRDVKFNEKMDSNAINVPRKKSNNEEWLELTFNTNEINESSEDGSSEDGSNEDGSNEDGSNEDGSNEDGSNEDGSNEDGSNEGGSNEDGSNEDGSNEDGSNEKCFK